MYEEIFKSVFLGNTVLEYLISLVIIISGIIVIKIFRMFVLKFLKNWSQQTDTTIDDFIVRIVGKTLVPLIYYGIFYVSIQHLILPPSINKFSDILGVILLTILGILFLSSITDYTIRNYWLKKSTRLKEKSVRGILPAIKIFIWGLGIIFLLDNLGFEISAVIAGLGLGGIAVAMASQAILKDLFSYFAILFDRPFEIGDFIIVGDLMGSVEQIGLKTTKLRSLSGEQLVFANTDLCNSRIRNYMRMKKRRVAFEIGLTYETGSAQLKKVPDLIKKIITDMDQVQFDRAHFSSYGEFSLIFEIVYYVLTSDYNLFMDIQQQINLKLKDEFEKNNIVFAYPTQTLHLSRS